MFPHFPYMITNSPPTTLSLSHLQQATEIAGKHHEYKFSLSHDQCGLWYLLFLGSGGVLIHTYLGRGGLTLSYQYMASYVLFVAFYKWFCHISHVWSPLKSTSETWQRLKCRMQEEISCLKWLGETSLVASGCCNGDILVWDARSGVVATTFRGHSKGIQSLSVSADCNFLVSASKGGTGRVFDISKFK